MSSHEPTWSGVTQRIPGDRTRRAVATFEQELQFAAAQDAHYWVAFLIHRVSYKEAGGLVRGDPEVVPLFDSESLRDLQFGCYRCNEALSAEVLRAPCSGSPDD
jgi:hypothetical protein